MNNIQASAVAFVKAMIEHQPEKLKEQIAYHPDDTTSYVLLNGHDKITEAIANESRKEGVEWAIVEDRIFFE